MKPCSINIGEGQTTSNGVTKWAVNAKSGLFPSDFTSAGSLAACPGGRFDQTPGSQVLISVGMDAPTFDGIVSLQNETFGYTAGSPNVPDVTLTWADSSRPAGVAGLSIINVNSLTVSGLTLTTGDALGGGSPKQFLINQAGVGCTSACFFVTKVQILNPNNYQARGKLTGLAVGCSQYLEIDTLTIHSAWTAFNDLGPCQGVITPITSSHNVINDMHIRYFTANAIFFGASQGWTLNDTWILSPLRESATHVDSAQFYDAVQTSNLTMNRTVALMADGTASMQGTPFQGRAGDAIGWIDDGSQGAYGYSGIPGTMMHVQSKGPNGMDFSKSPAGMQAWPQGEAGDVNVLKQGTTLVTVCKSPSVTTLPTAEALETETDLEKQRQADGPLLRSETPDCTIDPIHAQLVGSPNSYVEFMSSPDCNNVFNGLYYAAGNINGITIRSNCGTSAFKNFTLVKSNGYQNGAALYNNFKGQITQVPCQNNNTSNTCELLTITGDFSGPNGLYATGTPTTHILYPQNCNYAAVWQAAYSQKTCTYDVSLSTQNKTYGLTPDGYPDNLDGGTSGQFVLVPGARPPATGTVGLTATTDTPDPNGPVVEVKEADVPLQHMGTMLMTSGYVWDKLNLENHAGNVVGTTPLPSGWTVTHLHFGCLSTSVTSPPDLATCSDPGTTFKGSAGAAHDNAVHAFAGTNCGDAVDQGGCDPQVYFSLTAPSHWAAMSDKDVVEEAWKLIKPKGGGTLDNGDGTYDGAQTNSGNWNDGSGTRP
jgi:hypothetical protein